MKSMPGIGLAVFIILLSASCSSLPISAPTPTPQIFTDAAFSGCAYLDENGNGQVDPQDPGLQGLTFTVLGWGDRTSQDGCAFVLIPGGVSDHLWPVTVRMKPPEGAPYEPVGPTEIIVTKDSRQGHFDFLFRRSPSTPTTSNLPSPFNPPAPLYVLSERSGTPQVWQLATAGGFAPLTDVRRGVAAFDVAPDGAVLYLTRDGELWIAPAGRKGESHRRLSLTGGAARAFEVGAGRPRRVSVATTGPWGRGGRVSTRGSAPRGHPEFLSWYLRQTVRVEQAVVDAACYAA
jgi:hypothetical protein